MDEKRKSLITDSSDDCISNKKSLLEELAYCPTSIEVEPESIKRYYINPEEISDIFEKVLFDE